MDWLFMIGLLGIGVALLLGVALRPAAASGALLVMMMWFAVWPPAVSLCPFRTLASICPRSQLTDPPFLLTRRVT